MPTASLNGSVAVVTGATRGIGRAIAHQLAAAGARVALAGRDVPSLETVAAELPTASVVIAGDVADTDAAQAAVDRVVRELGPIDILVNNAGIGTFGDLASTPPDAFRRMLEVNVVGTYAWTRAVLPQMYERAAGQVLTICSDVAERVFAEGSGYCASKHAQLAFVEAVRAEARPRGVRVTALLPGIVDTSFAGATEGGEGREWMLRADDVADAALFVLSRPAHVIVDDLTIHPIAQEW